MSVIIKGMGMPVIGTKYRVVEDLEGNKYLRRDGFLDGWYYPVSPLPEKHGRLVDADTLSDEYILLSGEVRGFRIETLGVGNGRATLRFKQWKDVPTVVEAEGDDS